MVKSLSTVLRCTPLHLDSLPSSPVGDTQRRQYTLGLSAHTCTKKKERKILKESEKKKPHLYNLLV